MRRSLAGSFFNRHAIIPCETLTACQHTVSGTLSLPSRGAFHRSLTVLFAIGVGRSRVLGGGPPGFPPGFTCRVVLGNAHPTIQSPWRRDFHPLGCGIPTASPSALHPRGSPWIVDPWSAPQPAESPAILRATSSRRLDRARFARRYSGLR